MLSSSSADQQYYHLVWADDDYHSALDHNANEREGIVCVLRQINFEHSPNRSLPSVHIQLSELYVVMIVKSHFENCTREMIRLTLVAQAVDVISFRTKGTNQ